MREAKLADKQGRIKNRLAAFRAEEAAAAEGKKIRQEPKAPSTTRMTTSLTGRKVPRARRPDSRPKGRWDDLFKDANGLSDAEHQQRINAARSRWKGHAADAATRFLPGVLGLANPDPALMAEIPAVVTETLCEAVDSEFFRPVPYPIESGLAAAVAALTAHAEGRG